MKIQTPFLLRSFGYTKLTQQELYTKKCTGEREDCGNIKQMGLIGE